MFSRSSLRIFQNTRLAFQDATAPLRRRTQNTSKRLNSTDAASATNIEHQSFLQRSWNSPIGVRTVHFWAPVMKWILVLAGIGDMARPADKLSLTQNAALTATGFIWTRWSMIIRPKNILLGTVNFFVGCVGAVQVSRILKYRASLKESESQKQASAEVTTPSTPPKSN